jgi:prepilin-type N-terminal cleavage/methylation domain-containing protein
MKKGLTLIELMVVIVIMGVLASLAIPRFFGMTAKAKAAEMVIVLKSFEKLKGMYYELYGLESSSPAEIGFILPTDSKYFNYDFLHIASNWDGVDGGLSTAGKGKDKDKDKDKDDEDNGNGAGSGEVVDGEYVDDNHGHGNDPDGCDEDNPGLVNGGGKKSCRDQNEEGDEEVAEEDDEAEEEVAEEDNEAEEEVAEEDNEAEEEVTEEDNEAEEEVAQEENSGQGVDYTAIANSIRVHVVAAIGSECGAGAGVVMTWSPTGTTYSNTNNGNCGVYMPTLFK